MSALPSHPTPVANGPVRGLGGVFNTLAVTLLLLVVCALPWIHGGRIPLARLVLQLGMVLAGSLSLCGPLLRGKRDRRIPVVVIPLIVLAAIGLLQLLPIHEPLISKMQHAARPELRSALDASPASHSAVRTASPADTRFVLAQVTALALVALVAFDQIRSRRTVLVCFSVVAANATVNAVLAILQMFSGKTFLVNPHWMMGIGSPFSTFVNPNGAAGWLCLGLAATAGLLVYQLSMGISSSVPGSRFSLIQSTREFTGSLVSYVAQLTGWQLLAWISLGFIGVAIAAARSRAGIVAALAGMAIVCVSRLSVRQIPAVLLTLMVGTTAIGGLLVLFNLDEGVLTELRTLRDPLSAAGARFDHWSDSLVMLNDFPLLGSGMGAYKFATLPYQQHFSDNWFQHADNQFVEVLVECGYPGFVAFVMVGVIGLIHGLVLYRSGINDDFPGGGTRRRLETAVGAAVLFGVSSQLVAGMFDFGLGLPPAAALLVLLISVGSRVLGDSATKRSERRTARMPHFQAINVPWPVVLSIKLGVIASAASFIPDLWAATQLYPYTVASKHSLHAPITQEVLQQRANASRELDSAMAGRIDDSDAQWIRMFLAEDALRRRILNSVGDVSELTDDELQDAWQLTSAPSLSNRVYQLQKQGFIVQARTLHRSVRAMLQESRFLDQLGEIQNRFLLMPRVAERLAVWHLLDGDVNSASKDIKAATFVESMNAELAFRIGYAALRRDLPQLADDLWQRSLRLSERFRRPVLQDALNHWSVNETLQKFGPQDYSACVAAFTHLREPSLREALLARADAEWVEPHEPPARKTMDDRRIHLRYAGRDEELAAWLEKCLHWNPDDIRFRESRATALDRLGKLKQSLEEWRRIEFLDPDNKAARRKVKSLESRPATNP